MSSMPALRGPRVTIYGKYTVQFRTAPELHGILGEWEPARPARIDGQAARKYRAARASFLALLAAACDARIEFLDARTGEREHHAPPPAGHA